MAAEAVLMVMAAEAVVMAAMATRVQTLPAPLTPMQRRPVVPSSVIP